MKLANYGHRNTPGTNSRVFEITVKFGDSLDKIARAQESTVEMLKQLNPTAGTLRVGQILKCRKAVMQRIITGWRPVTTTVVAQRYNGGGDPHYARKLDQALALVRQGKGAPCEA
jgi:LysM repeat protein